MLSCRTIMGFAVAALAMLGLANPANAENSDRLLLLHVQGVVAHGSWEDSSGAFNFVEADKRSLFVSLERPHVDASGTFTGSTKTLALVTSGYSIKVTEPLQEVAVQASGLPAEACEYDADFNLIGCADTTIGSLDITYHGVGPITQDREVQHRRFGSLLINAKNADFERLVHLTGTLDGVPLPWDASGDMHHYHGSGHVAICIGKDC